MDEQITNYLLALLPEKDNWIVDLEEQAQKDRVPIMDSIGMDFIMQLIRMNKPSEILEIGTGIGYSALRMLEASPESTITTIEKDEKRYNQAKANLKKYDNRKKVTLVQGDALSIMTNMVEHEGKFDCIFIDAAKGQYEKYFDLADSLLINNGFIIADNVLFRGYIADYDFEHRRYKSIVNRLREYNKRVTNHSSYHTSIVPVGDGVAISFKSSERSHTNEK